MKKLSLLIFAIVFSLGGIFVSPAFTSAIEEPIIEFTEVRTSTEFITKMNGSANIVLGNDIDFNGQVIHIDEFSGNLDGNGFTISNFVVKSDNHSYGLVNQLNGGKIYNLRLNGSITYDLTESNKTPVNIGGFAGLVSGGGIIKNCEIVNINYNSINKVSVEGVEDTKTSENQLHFVTQFTFGGVAGAVVGNKSTVTNCVNHSGVDLSTSLSATNVMRAGGIVGRLHDGSVNFCSALGNITYSSNVSSSNITFYNGGIIGEVEGSETKAYNLTYEGAINRVEQDNYASLDSASGAIIGRISTLVDKDRIDISNCYWTNGTLENAFGENDVYTYDTEVVNRVRKIDRNFYTSPNWHKRYGEWDFDYTWIMLGEEDKPTKLHLQCFQNFKYSFNDFLDADGILKKKDSQEIGEYKYGSKVEINLEIENEYLGFFDLQQVLLNSNPITDYEKKETLNGFTIVLTASDKTDGRYSFKMKEIPFKCYVESEDINKGGVKRLGDRVVSSRIELTLSYTKNESQKLTIISETDTHSIYTPLNWTLYYKAEEGQTPDKEDSDGKWVLQPNFPSYSNSQLEFLFGKDSVFNRSFKLVANYTDEEAFVVNVRGDDNVSYIKFLGLEMSNDGIQTSPSETRAELVVSVKEGYELDVDRLKGVVSSLYGNNNVGTLIPSSPQVNEKGETTYYIYLNMREIDKNKSGLNISLNVYTKVKTVEENDSLLWLWIILPIVAVLIVVSIILFVIIRRRRLMKARLKIDGANTKTDKKNKSKEKSADYKDFYY